MSPVSPVFHTEVRVISARLSDHLALSSSEHFLMGRVTVNQSKQIISFRLKEQLMITLQYVNEVNRERSRLAVASGVYDSTKHNGLVAHLIK